ncbi:MAG: DoxX family protein [Isosphaeraceae bacterium]
MARYYPGFLAAFFIIVLRVAIGWHFLNEGVEKYESTLHGKEGFSAEVYLRNATGPLAPHFRQIVPDVDSRDMLDLSKLKAAWRSEVERVADHFGFSEAQRSQVAKVADESERWADAWFASPDNAEKREKYFHDLDQVEKAEQDPDAMSYELERAWEARRSVEADRRSLIGPLVEQGKSLRDAVAKLATSEQLASAGTVSPPITQLDLINITTTYGIMVIGVCLILGLLTPLAALSAATFLAMIYLSMPPWPGLPPNPKTEGHYFIVSKNLVELIACLVIATTPSGHWIGLDALFFGARRRRRLALQASNANPSTGTDHPVPPRAPDRDLDEDHRKPIPIG